MTYLGYKVLGVLERLFEVLFQGYAGKRSLTQDNIASFIKGTLDDVYGELSEQIENAFYGTINGGGPMMTFETYHGNIYIRNVK